jgi:hypothetical protein
MFVDLYEEENRETERNFCLKIRNKYVRVKSSEISYELISCNEQGQKLSKCQGWVRGSKNKNKIK